MEIRSMMLPIMEYEIGDVFNTFFMSDLHIESPSHNRDLLIKDFEYAKKKKAIIFLGGDVVTLIVSGDRKRFTPSSEKFFGEDDVFNFTVEEVVKVLTPYAYMIKGILCGNHEANYEKFNHADILATIIWELNKLENVNIEYLGYEAYIRLRYKYKNGGFHKTFDIKGHHGTGGQAEVTKGTITLNRFMTYHFADLYWNGHLHTKVVLPDEPITYMDRMGNICIRSRKGIITGSYLFPVINGKTKFKSGRPRSYKIDYGHTKRTLQSSGGILMEQTFVSKEEMETRIIC